MPLTLSGIVIIAVVMAMLVNTGNRVTVKTAMAHAADSAALSGATYAAQHLNAMAYLNRAMVANHVGAGHMTAFISWIRYVEDAIHTVDKIATIYPPAKKVTSSLRRGAKGVTRLGETAASVYIPAVDELNRFYSLVQVEANTRFALNNTVNDVMRQTLNEHATNIRLNVNALEDFVPLEGSAIAAALAHQQIKMAAFTHHYGVNERDGEIKQLVNSSIARNKFINDRDWRLWLIKKESSTRQYRRNNGLSWVAEDRLRIKRFKRFKLRWKTIARGRATTTEFDTGYRGIHRYVSLTDKENAHHVLPIVAAVSTPQSDIYTRPIMGLEKQVQGGITGLAVAQVEFVRPRNGFFKISGDEYANMFNAFWTARITGSSISDLAQIYQSHSNWRGGE